MLLFGPMKQGQFAGPAVCFGHSTIAVKFFKQGLALDSYRRIARQSL